MIAAARDGLKRLLLNALPEPALQPIRRGYYARMLRRGDEDPEPDLTIAEEFLRPGDWVADIGANIGVFTKPFSRRVGPAGVVYALEPVPVTYDVLCSNVRRLRLANVRPLPCAVSDADGVAAMEVPLRESGWSDFYRARIVPSADGSRRPPLQITARTVDSLWADAERPLALIKCDVEGHELACLRGAWRVVARFRPAWLLEVTGDPDQPGSDARAVFALLGGWGYGAFWFDGARLRTRRPGDTSVNYWFLTPEHLRERLPARAVAEEATAR